ncbi:MAG: DUF3052 domain-containing protein [Chloroflexota bacterium]|nr:DUF3052 family protein [Chloroflexota bacterium]NOG64525.1 DUF3052 domain-containing protein [Chloroflexota bacterium]GIK66073.1 MAG: DUF3052 domain-containing protein [Chloroflexota bacterium]
MAGYSKKSLVEKLGIKLGAKIAILNAPANYDVTLGPLPDGVERSESIQAGADLDFIQFFTTSRAEFLAQFDTLKAAIKQNGMVWVSWPKKAAKMPTDLDENIVRDIALENGLVDVKVAAIDEVWSGLKLVYRVKDRK